MAYDVKRYTPIELSSSQKQYASVKYANHFNKASLGSLSPTELNILHSILVELRKYGASILTSSENIPEIIKVSISFSEIYKLCSLDARHNSEQELFKVVQTFAQKAMSMSPLIEITPQEDAIKWTYFFHAMIFDQQQKLFFIEMDQSIFRGLLLELNNGYTQFDLTEFLSIKTKYAKLLYRLLKQYKTTGYMLISIADLKAGLEIPKSYNWSAIKKQIIEKSVDELKKPFDMMDLACKRIAFANLAYEPIFSSGYRGSRGRTSVEQIKFTFDKVINKQSDPENQQQ